MGKTLPEMYKELPDARQIPDIIWTAQKILDEMSEVAKKRICLQEELESTMITVMSYLHTYWSKEELLKVGLMSE